MHYSLPSVTTIRVALLIIFLIPLRSFSQQNTTGDPAPKINISGYVDAYYASYSDSVGISNYQKFPSVSPRSNQFGINTAQLTAQYDAEKVRGVFTIHFGDIAKSVWSSAYNPIMEAHAGIRLCKTLWLEQVFLERTSVQKVCCPKKILQALFL